MIIFKRQYLSENGFESQFNRTVPYSSLFGCPQFLIFFRDHLMES